MRHPACNGEPKASAWWCRHMDALRRSPSRSTPCSEWTIRTSDFEVIVVDDGSDVATERVVRARQTGSIAMEYRAQPNSGAATARNHGARVAAGQHLFFCDDDIVVQRNHLRSVSGILGKFPNALVNGDLHFAPRVEEELRRDPVRALSAGTRPEVSVRSQWPATGEWLLRGRPPDCLQPRALPVICSGSLGASTRRFPMRERRIKPSH